MSEVEPNGAIKQISSFKISVSLSSGSCGIELNYRGGSTDLALDATLLVVEEAGVTSKVMWQSRTRWLHRTASGS